VLAITTEASEAIKGVLAADDVPDGAMLRISPQPQSESAAVGLVVEVTESPPPNDQVIESNGVEVCLEPTAAEMLDDKELDATLVDGKVNLSIGDQSA
jgi:Fe-S cluster assembly iron-binding protein IscA